jgi:hypothetical protein
MPDKPNPAQDRPKDEAESRPAAPRSAEEKGSLTGEDPVARTERDLVAPSGVNEGDHGSAEDTPQAGGSVNLDDDDMVHPRGKVTSQGGTWKAEGGDSAPLGAPREVLSDRNGPSDPDNRNKSR